MRNHLIAIAAAIIATVVVGLSVAYFVLSDGNSSLAYGIVTIIVGVVTFFGLVSLPGGLSEDGNFDERRVRFAITATLVIVYVVYLGTTSYWNEKEKMSEYGKLMTQTLTNLLSIVIAFYFGATAAVEVFSRRKKDDK